MDVRFHLNWVIENQLGEKILRLGCYAFILHPAPPWESRRQFLRNLGNAAISYKLKATDKSTPHGRQNLVLAKKRGLFEFVSGLKNVQNLLHL
jgi:hypothetical protein